MKRNIEYIAVFLICAAFFLGWYLVFGTSSFFTKDVMQQTPPVPAIEPMGADLRLTLASASELVEKRTPYISAVFYPPLVFVVFSPLVHMEIHQVYQLVGILTTLSMIASLFMLDIFFSKGKSAPSIFFFMLATAFFSYGFHFEIERGQFNVITLLCVIIGMVLFASKRKIPGLLFLTFAIQMKVYPAIFFLLFFNQELRKKQNLLLFAATGLLNFLLLFILGKQSFDEFKFSLFQQIQHPFLWVGNHSLFAYCSGVASIAFCDVKTYPYFFGFILLLLGLAVGLAWLQRLHQKTSTNSINPYLFSLCGLSMLLIPAVSHDYTLSMVPIVLLPAFKEMYTQAIVNKKYLNLLFLPVGVFLYTLSLFSVTNSTVFFPYSANKAPVLFGLIIVTFLALLTETFTPLLKTVLKNSSNTVG